MSSSFKAALRQAVQCPAWQQNLFIPVLALLTALWIWLEGGRVLDVESLQTLWRSVHEPQNLFECLLVPLQAASDAAAALMALISTLSLCLFCRISRLVGIGPQTTFLLFLLLNFNPEYNDVRLQVSAFQPAMLLWLTGLYLFLAYYRNYLYWAFLAWALTVWLAALFVPAAAFWAGGFPLLFLFWPGRSNCRQRLRERGLFLLAYYALIVCIILVVTPWREAVTAWLPAFIQNLDLKRHDMSFFINANNPVDISLFEGFLIALLLVVVNAAKIIGPVIVLLIVLAVTRRAMNTVLEMRVRLFFAFSLGYFWVLSAFAFMYYDALPSDLYYTPITMLTLWLVSGVVFYALQRVKSGRIPPQRLLILAWLMVAYALASIITFGPSLTYLREAGEWTRQQHAGGRVFSNSLTALYYGGGAPFRNSDGFAEMGNAVSHYYDISTGDLYIHIQGRNNPQQPDDFELFDILNTFANERGDKAYILRPKAE